MQDKDPHKQQWGESLEQILCGHMSGAKQSPLVSGLCCLEGVSAWTSALRAGLGASGTEVGHSSQDEGLTPCQWSNALKPLSSTGAAEDYLVSEADWISGNQGSGTNLNKKTFGKGEGETISFVYKAFLYLCLYREVRVHMYVMCQETYWS